MAHHYEASGSMDDVLSQLDKIEDVSESLIVIERRKQVG